MSAETEPASRQRRARALREQVDDAPVTLPRDRYLERFSPPPDLGADVRPDVYARSLLAMHGMRPHSRNGDVRVEPTPRYAIQGAIAVSVVAALLAFPGFWAYGLIFLAAGGIAVALLATRFGLVARLAPGWLPRGRLLGGVLAAALIVVAGLAVVLPIRMARTPGTVVAQQSLGR